MKQLTRTEEKRQIAEIGNIFRKHLKDHEPIFSEETIDMMEEVKRDYTNMTLKKEVPQAEVYDLPLFSKAEQVQQLTLF
jgi:hypothetical protein